MAGEGENLGVATIYLTVDKTSMDATIGKAKLQLAGMGAEASKQYEAMSASQQKMAQGLVRQAELINRTTAERIAYNAQLKIGGALGDEIAAKALANAQATAAAQDEVAAAAKAAEAAQAEMAAAEDARFQKIAADAMAEVAARDAIAAATMEQARASAVLAEAQGAGTAGAAAGAAGTAGMLDTAVVQQQIADYAALDAIMGKKVVTTEEVAAAEAALDRLQAAGMLSNEQLAESFAALDVATAAETKSLQANSVAQVENASASTLNSRTQYELGIMLGEVASGNINRLKRSTAALANSTGLLKALMTPVGLVITGVIATLALFGKAVYDREKDLENFNKALAATGDYAGMTGLQLQGIAAQIGQSTGHYSDATAAVLALAKSGDVLGSHLQDMATVAVNMSQLTGESVESITKALIGLQDDPTKAIAKLTSAMGLLTAAQFDQIAETQQQQGASAAAALAMKDLADASDAARNKMVQNAGDIIKIWENFKSLLHETGDLLGSIGAELSTGEQIANLQKQLNVAYTAAVGGGNPDPNKDANVVSLRAQISALKLQQQSDQWFANGQELGNQAKQAHDQALAEFLSSTKQGDEGFVSQAQEINKKRYEALVGIVDPTTIAKVNAAADQQIRDAAKRLDSQYPHNPSTAHHADPAATALATFQSQVNGLSDKALNVTGDSALTKYVQGVAQLNDEFDKAIAKHADLTKAQAAYDDGMKALNQTLDKNEAAQADEAKATQMASDAKIAAYKAQIALQVASVGMGDKEIQQAQQLAQIQTQYADQIEKLQEKAARNPDQKDAIDVQIATATREMNAMVQATKDGFAEMDTAESNWANGAIAAMKNWVDQGANVAGQVKGLFTNAFGNMNDALVNFVQTGKLNFKSLIDGFIADLVRMELRIVESRILTSILGAIAGDGGYYGGVDLGGGYSTTGATELFGAGVGGGGYAKGGVFGPSGEITAFASGGIVSAPTLFPFAKGTGLMGEAGPEAIMPLTRGPDGKLGVQAQGGSTGELQVEVNITNQSGQAVQGKQTGQRQDGRKVIIDMMLQAVATDVVSGGQTAKAMQQRFGLQRRGVPVGA